MSTRFTFRKRAAWVGSPAGCRHIMSEFIQRVITRVRVELSPSVPGVSPCQHRWVARAAFKSRPCSQHNLVARSRWNAVKTLSNPGLRYHRRLSRVDGADTHAIDPARSPAVE
jgi:hypothetical protein